MVYASDETRFGPRWVYAEDKCVATSELRYRYLYIFSEGRGRFELERYQPGIDANNEWRAYLWSLQCMRFGENVR